MCHVPYSDLGSFRILRMSMPRYGNSNWKVGELTLARGMGVLTDLNLQYMIKFLIGQKTNEMPLDIPSIPCGGGLTYHRTVMTSPHTTFHLQQAMMLSTSLPTANSLASSPWKYLCMLPQSPIMT